AAERAAPVADGPAGAQRPFEAPQRGPAPLAGEVGVAEAVQGQPLAIAVAAGARFGEAPLEPPVRGLPAAQAVPGVEVAHVELRAGVARLADDGARGREVPRRALVRTSQAAHRAEGGQRLHLPEAVARDAGDVRGVL